MKSVFEVKHNITSEEALFSDVFKKIFYSSMFAIICGCIGQIVGNIVIGNKLGEGRLAVMSLVLPVYYIFATIGNLSGIGGSALCADCIGKRKFEDCKKAFTVTYVFTVILCILFSVAVLALLPNVVKLLGTPDELFDDVKRYCAIMSGGGVFTACVYLSFNFLRLDGKSVATTLTFVIMAVLNVILDIILSFLGISGIAIANIAGSMAASLFGVFLLSSKSNTLKFCKVDIKEIFSYSLKIIKIGSPGATENASILFKSYFLNTIITSTVGAAVLSSLSVVNSINSFSLGITVGSAGALVPFIGVFSAEKDTASIRKILRSSIVIGGIILSGFIAVTVVFAPQIAGVFGIKNGAEDAVKAIRLFAISLPFALLSNNLIYLHLANKHTFLSNILTLAKYLVFAVLFAFVFLKSMGTVGLWLSFAATEFMTLVLAALLHLAEKHKNSDLSAVLLLDTAYEKDGKTFSYVSQDDDESIADAVLRLGEFCEQNEISTKKSMVITLSMDEMLHMAAEHSTRSGDRHIISIRVIILDEILVMRLRYVGTLFNPIEYYETKKTDSSDIDAMLELADCLGMKMVTDTCDVVDYRTTFGINNLTIIANA